MEELTNRDEILKELEELHDFDIFEVLKEIKDSTVEKSEEWRKCGELEKAIEKIDLSIAQAIEYDTSASSSSSKRKRTGSENSGKAQVSGKNKKSLEEVRKQIDLVKNALDIAYEMENKTYKSLIARNRKGKKNKDELLKRIIESGRIIPLWIDTGDEKPPPLCGAVKAEDNYIAEVGDLVAAFENTGKVWILAEVTGYDPVKKLYKVEDIYESKIKEQILKRDEVIPLPKFRVNPEVNSELLFQEQETVLALYPTSTCFYAAIVDKMPTNAREPYTLLFNDDINRYHVHQRFVIPCTEKEKVKRKI